MSFKDQLTRLREAASTRHRGRMGHEAVIQKADLAELIYHFDRLDHEARIDHAKPGMDKTIITVVDKETKLYCLNGDGSAEWIFARNKHEALDFATNMWGASCVLDHFENHLRDNQNDSVSDFIEYFVQEEPGDKMFAFTHENGTREIKTIKEWIKDSKECPSYFASEEF